MREMQNKIFQFHKGTIRTMVNNSGINGVNNFNSIKVRLEPGSLTLLAPLSKFQFHKGTIRTRGASEVICL